MLIGRANPFVWSSFESTNLRKKFVFLARKKKTCKKSGNFAVTNQINHQYIMDRLPKDPFMLVSAINMLLRDEEFDSLESLCNNFDRDPKEVKAYLLKYDYEYSEEQKQMRPVGYNE